MNSGAFLLWNAVIWCPRFAPFFLALTWDLVFHLTEPKRVCDLDRVNLAQILQDGLVHFAVYLDHGDSLARFLRVIAAAQREVGDVQLVLPEERSPPPASR